MRRMLFSELDRLLFRRRSTGLAVALLLAATAFLAAPGSARAADDWERIEPSEADLNVAAITKLAIRSVHSKITRGGVRADQYEIEDQKVRGILMTQRSVDGFFHEGRAGVYGYESKFADQAVEILELKPGSVANLEAIEHDRRRVAGHIASAELAPPSFGVACWVALASYRLGHRTNYDNDRGQFDTVVFARLCGSGAEKAQLLKIMSQIDLVKNDDSY